MHRQRGQLSLKVVEGRVDGSTGRLLSGRQPCLDLLKRPGVIAKLEPVELSFTRKSGEAGRLFGSVTSADVATALAAAGFEIDRRKIQLDEPLKTIGDFKVAIRLHREVTAQLKVKVLAEATEETPAEAATEAPAAEAAAE